MADWANGYVTELGYTHGYYRELSPLAIRFALHCAGYAAPAADNFDYCELGFGQGVSLNFHAAAHPDSRFVGADINPAHVASARELVEASGATLTLHDAGFADLLALGDSRDALPQFDYIGVHGVWSWISADNQASLVELVRRHLKPGGVLYLSYNCLPGWAAAAPLRHLIVEQARRAGHTGVTERFDDGLAFAQKLAATGLGYFAPAQGLKDRLDGMARQNRNYLVHEYMNRDWRSMHFAEVAEVLGAAHLGFAASASPIEQIDSLRVPAAGLDVLKDISDPIHRQTVRDYLVNQQFRKDLFVRGPRPLTTAQQKRLLDATWFVAQRPLDRLVADDGDAARRGLPEPLRRELADALAQDGGRAHTLAELTAACPNASQALLRQALMVLVSSGDLAVAQDPQTALAARVHCDGLNQLIAGRAGEGQEIGYLCSPVSGGAVPVGAMTQLMLAAAQRTGSLNIDQLAHAALDHLRALGQRVVTGGKTCQTVDDNLQALRRIATEFVERDLALLKPLGVATGVSA